MSESIADADQSLPQVSFVLPVLNAADLLETCLQTVDAQDYPRDRLEVIVADGGSTDGTRAVAEAHGARVVDNPLRLAEPGVDIGMKAARGEILFVMAADNGLPVVDWVRRMVAPFQRDPEVAGVYTQIVHHTGDNGFTRYYCRLHVEPFTWFVYGDACNPRTFGRAYDLREQHTTDTIYAFDVERHPLLALAQAFGVRRTFLDTRAGTEADDIIPIIQMIERGEKLAYVPSAGVYHHHLTSFTHFLRKYQWRIHNSFYTDSAGFDNRRAYMSRARRAKKYLFEIYGLSVVLPAIDGLRLWARERDPCMLWHLPASVSLAGLILFEWLRRRLHTSRGAVKDVKD